MKLFTFIILFWAIKAHANKLFIEPGIFVNMMDSASAEFNDGTSHDKGKLRNKYLSYAVKFGMHFGHYEFGVESEIYNFVAHLENDSGNYSRDMQITYNSIFFGYEFIPTHYLYIALSNTPYMSAGGKSYTEHHNVLSLEYSKHIKEWVSLNLKVETASKLEVENNSNETAEFGNLLLVGFSFPLTEE